MAVSLTKGGKVSLVKAAADAGVPAGQGITKVTVGLGWDVNAFDSGSAFDLDASVFLGGADGKVLSDKHFVFYGNQSAPGVQHTGDNTTGDGDGDDESINIDLTAVEEAVQKIAFSATIYDADTRNQNFGMVSNAYIRVVDQTSGIELLKYDLGEDFSIETAIVAGELYRHNGEWKFNAIGSGFAGGLGALCGNYGVDI